MCLSGGIKALKDKKNDNNNKMVYESVNAACTKTELNTLGLVYGET